jgi:hypothetical protein
VLAEYQSNRFVRPAPAPPGRLLAWARTANAHLPDGFECLALSPVCPLGTCSAVAPVHQDGAVVTVRNTEVVSDLTNVLALECAVRRRARKREDPTSTAPVHLAAHHRLLRTQPFAGPLSFAHFAVFGLCSAGRDAGGLRFELATIALHARVFIGALRTHLGPDTRLALRLTDFGAADRRAQLEAEVLDPIGAEFDRVGCEIDEARAAGRGYYRDLCFQIDAQTPAGDMLNLADGGTVDWTQQLLSDRKERLVISGVGSDRVCLAFAPDAPSRSPTW